MPGLDRTGPNGEGSQTGRKLGRCNPNNNDKQNNETTLGPRSGLGRGRGRGLGLGNETGRGPGNGLGRGRRRGFGHE